MEWRLLTSEELWMRDRLMEEYKITKQQLWDTMQYWHMHTDEWNSAEEVARWQAVVSAYAKVGAKRKRLEMQSWITPQESE